MMRHTFSERIVGGSGQEEEANLATQIFNLHSSLFRSFVFFTGFSSTQVSYFFLLLLIIKFYFPFLCQYAW